MFCKKSKRAEVPVVILVLGVLLLCVIVAVAKFGGNGNPGKMGEVVDMEKCLSLIEQYTFYKGNFFITGYSINEIQNLPTFKGLISEGNLVCKSKSMEIKYPLGNIK